MLKALARAKQATGIKIKGEAQKLIDELSDMIQIADKIIEQTEEVNKGNLNSKDRIISVLIRVPGQLKVKLNLRQSSAAKYSLQNRKRE